VLFRSSAFAGLAGSDLAAFDRLGIATVYDFRTDKEVRRLEYKSKQLESTWVGRAMPRRAIDDVMLERYPSHGIM
jgi:hypothetical protein